MGFEIRDYNTMDDWSLFLLMLSDNSLEEKKYIFTNFSERLNNMEEDIFLQMIRQLKFDDVMGLSDYICAKIKNFKFLFNLFYALWSHCFNCDISTRIT